MRGGRGIRGVAAAVRQERSLGTGVPLPCASHYGGTPAAVVRRWGVARLPCVIHASNADSLRSFVLEELSRCAAAAASDPQLTDQWFSPGIYQVRAEARAAPSRWEFRLPLCMLVWDCLREALFGGSGLDAAFRELSDGEDPELWELAAAVSAPGAAPQVVHADTKFVADPCLFTAFVALQSVTIDMGPTRFLPGTHVEDAHGRFQEDPDAFLQDVALASSCSERRAIQPLGPVVNSTLRAPSPMFAALLDAGDASLYDSRPLGPSGRSIGICDCGWSRTA